MTVLVTGATGFLGAAVVRALLAQGEAVRAFVLPGSNPRNLADLDVERVEGNVTVRETITAAVRGCRSVIHVAADDREWLPSANASLETNVQGSLNVLDAAAEAHLERMVYTSTAATIGVRTDGAASDERTKVGLADMIGPASRAKFLAEKAVAGRAGRIGFDVVIVNPSTAIGPGDLRPTETGQLIVDALGKGMSAFVNRRLNLVHVDDVGAGHVQALERGRSGERYILGGQDLSLKQLLAIIASKGGRSAPKIRLPRWFVLPIAAGEELVSTFTRRAPHLTMDSVRLAGRAVHLSSRKAERELGYTSRKPEIAVADAIAWFERQGYL
jgi:dihydroflavonol-4-reductase